MFPFTTILSIVRTEAEIAVARSGLSDSVGGAFGETWMGGMEGREDLRRKGWRWGKVTNRKEMEGECGCV